MGGENISSTAIYDNGTMLCTPIITEKEFYLYMSIPAVVLIVLLMFTQRRMSFLHKYLHGRPGLLIPMNVLEGHSDRFMYVSAYGLTVSSILAMNSRTQLPIELPMFESYDILNLLLSMGVYIIWCYPIFACVTIHSSLGYLIGTLYMWTYTILDVLAIVWCFDSFTFDITIMSRAPVFIFIMILNCAFPIKFYRCFKKNKFSDLLQQTSTNDYLVSGSYERRCVQNLFRRAKSMKRTLQQQMCEASDSRDASSQEKDVQTSLGGFKYSSRILASITVGCAIIYLTVYLYIYGWIVFSKWLDNSVDYYILVEIIDKFNSSAEANNATALVNEIKFHVDVILYIWLMCVILATIFSIIHVFHFLTCHKRHLKEMQVGKFTGIKNISNTEIMAASLRFSGYQAAYLFLGFSVILWSLFFLLLLLMEVFILPIVKGYEDLWLNGMLRALAIPISVTLLVNIIQLLMGRFVFLQNPDWLSLDNRRLYFIMVYVFYFYNVVLGLFSCLFRIFKQLVLGVWFTSRLDYSTLSRMFERFDPGFQSYVGYLYVENSHTNPIMITFVSILLEHVERQKVKVLSSYDNNFSTKNNTGRQGSSTPKLWSGTSSRRSDGSGDDSETSLIPVTEHSADGRSGGERSAEGRRRLVARNRWHVLYTLLNNPLLRFTRITNTNYLEVRGQLERMQQLQAHACDKETRCTCCGSYSYW